MQAHLKGIHLVTSISPYEAYYTILRIKNTRRLFGLTTVGACFTGAGGGRRDAADRSGARRFQYGGHGYRFKEKAGAPPDLSDRQDRTIRAGVYIFSP